MVCRFRRMQFTTSVIRTGESAGLRADSERGVSKSESSAGKITTSRRIKSWFRCSRVMCLLTYADTSALERDFGYKAEYKFEDWIKELR